MKGVCLFASFTQSAESEVECRENGGANIYTPLTSVSGQKLGDGNRFSYENADEAEMRFLWFMVGRWLFRKII